MLILLYATVFYWLLYVIVSFIATYVLCRERNSPLDDGTLGVSLASHCLLKKIIVRSRSDPKEASELNSFQGGKPELSEL